MSPVVLTALLAAAIQGDANFTLVVEFDENKLRMQEHWQFTLREPAPAGSIRLQLPEGAAKAGINQGEDLFALSGVQAVTNSAPLSAGSHLVIFHYGLASGARARITWPAPDVPVAGARVAFPVLDGLSTNLGKPDTTRDSAGVRFELHDVPRPFEAGPFTVQFDGLPRALTWPRYGTAAASVLVAVLTLILLMQPHRTRESVDPLSVRKQRLVEAIRQLDAQPLDDTKAHQARRDELLAQLAGVLRRESSGEVG